MGLVGSLVEGYLTFLRYLVLLLLSPLIIPFVVGTWLASLLGRGALATILTILAAPFAFAWWATKTGFRFAGAALTSGATALRSLLLLPARIFGTVFAPKSMTGQYVPAAGH